MVVVDYQRGVRSACGRALAGPARRARFRLCLPCPQRSHGLSPADPLHAGDRSPYAGADLVEDAASFESLAFGEVRKFDDWSATLLPAGHVLGSAQLLYQDGQGTLLYTGDFKLRNGLSSEPAAIPQAETLIMETTYGLPRYQFPPTEETLGAIIKFCREALEEGETPVLFGYALGKAQEILAALQTANLPVMLHGAIARIAKVYEEFGVVFPPYAQFEAKASRGHVIICPPAINGSRTLQLVHRPANGSTHWLGDGYRRSSPPSG